jgi:hypothetical protein
MRPRCASPDGPRAGSREQKKTHFRVETRVLQNRQLTKLWQFRPEMGESLRKAIDASDV